MPNSSVWCFQESLCSDRGKEQAKAEDALLSAWLEINDSNHRDSNLAFSALPTCCCCCHALHSAAILRDSGASSSALPGISRGGKTHGPAVPEGQRAGLGPTLELSGGTLTAGVAEGVEGIFYLELWPFDGERKGHHCKSRNSEK